MGLLDKADAKGGGPEEAPVSDNIRAVIVDFCLEYPLFHCVVLAHTSGRKGLLEELSGLTAGHGAVCGELSGRNFLVLLPGELDMELFSHRISKSTGSIVVFQFTSDSPSVAIDTLRSHLP